MDSPIISVLMATYNRRGVLARTLPTILTQEFPSGQFEIVLVVDGSTDGTAEMLHSIENPSLRVVEQANRGPAAARQAALDHARGELVLFTDDDIRLSPEVLKSHLAAHRSSTQPIMVRGPIHVAPESPATLATEATRAWYEQHFRTFAPERNGARLPDDFLIFANTSVQRRLIYEVGGMDESIPFPQEGFELLLRLLKSGVPLRFAPRAEAFEVYSKSTRKYISSDARGLGRAEWLLCRKHPDYRVHSVFGAIGEGSRTKRALRRTVALHPLLPNLVLGAVLSGGEKFRRIGPVRNAAIRALALRYRTEVLRSGAREAGSWHAMEQACGLQLPVLMYHHVGPRHPRACKELTVEPQRFAEQVRWLANRGYTGIRACDWLEWCQHGKQLPDKPVVLTFDDAYAETFEYALPTLSKYNFSATVFVVTALVGEMDKWNDCGSTKSVLQLATAEQIREWANYGIEFGSHTRTHPDLRTLHLDDLRTEIVESMHELAAITGRSPVSFAYPFGFYDERVQTIVRDNYQMAFSVSPGINTLRSDLHLLRRLMVLPSDSTTGFASRVALGHNFIEEVRTKIRSLFSKRQASPEPLAAHDP